LARWNNVKIDDEEMRNLEIACRWCADRGDGWSIIETSGRGGTAPVFAVRSPNGERALKLYDPGFSEGERGAESERRLKAQQELGDHDCPYIVKIYEGGRFEDRLFLLMNRAPGRELEKRLNEVPRNKIRTILDQVAKACIYLRERGLCHRDIKAANIFVTDDFGHATLLDLSVMRGIYDPLGTGTDHDGQLPVVATSRYSPPEYLFRLVAPSAELWHALDIYQLGGLLHDLIMRQPMFQAEFLLSRENRYRLAWAVATVQPVVNGCDVDSDLLFLAHRALDKDWKRRSALLLEDFLDQTKTHRQHGLEALGLSIPGKPQQVSQTGRIALHQKISEFAGALDTNLRSRLRAANITATHEIKPGRTDSAKNIIFQWNSNEARTNALLQDVQLDVNLNIAAPYDAIVYTVELALAATMAGVRRSSDLALPAMPDESETVASLSGHIIDALGELATRLMRSEEKK
jgi:serine/threonine protein kinase